MAGAEDFLVLYVRVGNGQHLGAEAEFAEGAGHGVVREASVVGVDSRLAALDEGRADNAAIFHVEHAEGAVLIFHGKLAVCVGGDEIDLAGGQVRYIGFFPEAEAVRFLCLLGFESEGGGEDTVVLELEIDLN